MKRCPLCEFIYEDDQSLCDMDGIELVAERGELLAPADVAAHESVTAVRSRRRRSSLMLLVGVFLSAVTLSFSYSPEGASADTGHPPARGLAPAAPPVTAPAPPPAAPTTVDDETTREAAPPKGPSPAPPKPRASDLREERTRAGVVKKESKVGSIMNKAVRILKKPF